jgi:hypothetical protein
MSALEDELAAQLDGAGIRYGREYRAVQDRRFRWDFCIYELPLVYLIEVQGGTWHKGGHTTHDGLHRDYEKHNLATSADYRLLYFDADMIHDGTALATIRKAVER